MVPESEESRSLKMLRCAMKGLNRMEAEEGSQEEEDLRTLRMLDSVSTAGIIPKNFMEQSAPFAFFFAGLMVFYAFVFALKDCFL